MSLPKSCFHFFIPYEHNNHRARLLHPLPIAAIALAVVLLRVLLSFLPFYTPIALGYESSITPDKIVELTNAERVKKGLNPLSINSFLTKAALAKASDMMARDYWAHQAPDGRQPWEFIKEMGYQYRYAGENLARDFSASEDVVSAWMNSPSHRENLLSTRYQDIGIAVVEGDLKGVKTTLVVQFFGANIGSPLAIVGPLETAEVAAAVVENKTLSSLQQKLISIAPFPVTKNITLIIVGLLLIVFLVDIAIIRYRNTARVSSKSLAHTLFFGVIFIAILAAKSGLVK